MEWREVAPEMVDMDPAGVQAMVAWVEGRRARGLLGAQLVVLRRGKVVLDRVFGRARRHSDILVDPRTLFLTYSTSKPYVALLVHHLARQGAWSLDDTVARYWPEFARRGKDRITIRHVLQHRAGVPIDMSPAALVTMPDWESSVHRMEGLKPRYPAGAVPAYHALTFGFILGELIRRVTGVPVDHFLRKTFLQPLDLHDTYLGLPAAAWERRADVYPAGGVVEWGSAFLFNRRRYRQAVIPAATISSTARDVALFYEMLRRDGELHGVRVLMPDAIAEARRPSADNEVDRATGWRVRWGQGFQLGGNTRPGELGRSMGTRSSPEAFGHSGSQCCNAWVDPTRDLVLTYLTGRLASGRVGVDELAELSDLALDACL